MRVLLTGAAGFIGLRVLDALVNDGHTIVAVDDHSRGVQDSDYKHLVSNPCVDHLVLNLVERESWNSLVGHFDRVIHLAAINGTKHFYDRPLDVMSVNTRTVANLIDWHRETKSTARIVFTSSSEVYAGVSNIRIPTPESVPVGVNNIENPRWSYAISKIAGEALIRGYHSQYDATFTIIRPHNVYGPRMGKDHVIPEFIQRIESNETPFKIFGGNNTRAFCFVDDFVDGLIRVTKCTQTENITINLGNNYEEISIEDLATRLFALAGVSPPIKVESAPLGSALRRCPDLSIAKDLIGFSPTTSLNEGLRITYNWYTG